jgi:hypothetical protein
MSCSPTGGFVADLSRACLVRLLLRARDDDDAHRGAASRRRRIASTPPMIGMWKVQEDDVGVERGDQRECLLPVPRPANHLHPPVGPEHYLEQKGGAVVVLGKRERHGAFA